VRDAAPELEALTQQGPLTLSLLLHTTTAGVEWVEYHWFRARSASQEEADALQAAAVSEGAGAGGGREGAGGEGEGVGEKGGSEADVLSAAGPVSSFSDATTVRESFVLAGFDVLVRQVRVVRVSFVGNHTRCLSIARGSCDHSPRTEMAPGPGARTAWARRHASIRKTAARGPVCVARVRAHTQQAPTKLTPEALSSTSYASAAPPNADSHGQEREHTRSKERGLLDHGFSSGGTSRVPCTETKGSRTHMLCCVWALIVSGLTLARRDAFGGGTFKW